MALTGITQDMIDSGMGLIHAYNEMVNDVKKFNALPILHQWGVPDAYILKKELNDPNNWCFGRRWIDIKALAQTSLIINGKNFYGGLNKMSNKLGLPMQGPGAHRAGFDAMQTFLLYGHLARQFLL
jgi:DNA polymerase III alpha subunit (gram-positive type)